MAGRSRGARRAVPLLRRLRCALQAWRKSTTLPCIPRPQGCRAPLPIGAALVYAVSDSAAYERGALGNSEWMEE
jgi:hypothetical protein